MTLTNFSFHFISFWSWFHTKTTEKERPKLWLSLQFAGIKTKLTSSLSCKQKFYSWKKAICWTICEEFGCLSRRKSLWQSKDGLWSWIWGSLLKKIYNWKSNNTKIWSENRLWRRRPEKLHSQAENILYDPVLVHFKNLDVFSSFLDWFMEKGKVTTIKIVLQKSLTSASCSTRRGNNYKVFTFSHAVRSVAWFSTHFEIAFKWRV